MIHKRLIILDGDEDWIKRTLQKSLMEGTNIIGKGRVITVKTLDGMLPGGQADYKTKAQFENK